MFDIRILRLTGYKSRKFNRIIGYLTTLNGDNNFYILMRGQYLIYQMVCGRHAACSSEMHHIAADPSLRNKIKTLIRTSKKYIISEEE